MRRLTNGRLHGKGTLGCLEAGIALKFFKNRVHRVEHGDVNDGDGSGCSTRSELFSKHPVLAGSHRRVVESAGVDRYLVPTTNRIEVLPRPVFGLGVRTGPEERPERVT